jgi:hypothetical protein
MAITISYDRLPVEEKNFFAKIVEQSAKGKFYRISWLRFIGDMIRGEISPYDTLQLEGYAQSTIWSSWFLFNPNRRRVSRD